MNIHTTHLRKIALTVTTKSWLLFGTVQEVVDLDHAETPSNIASPLGAHLNL